jgi:uncharacterized protein
VPLRTGPDPGRIGREDGSCKPRSDRARNRRISASFLETPSAVTDSRPCVHFEEVGLQSKLLHRDGGATYVLVFDPGDEVISGLTAFAKDHGLDASDFTALGAFSSALLGFFDIEQKEYQKIPINEQVEVLTLVGNVTLDSQESKVHAHAVLGCADGTTRGGHLLHGHARPTLELILTEAPVQLRRRFNASAGLALIDL